MLRYVQTQLKEHETPNGKDLFHHVLLELYSRMIPGGGEPWGTWRSSRWIQPLGM